MFLQTSKDFLVRQNGSITAQGQDQIHARDGVLMQPETFTYETLDAITPHRGLYILTRNGQAKPCHFATVILPEYYKIFITAST